LQLEHEIDDLRLDRHVERRDRLVGDENGVSTIRLFPRQGDWASSRLAYTLDEMVTAD